MRILLTGGSGMLGRNILEHQQANQYTILAPNSGELNLLNEDAIKKFLIKERVEFIIHCAGLVGGIQANINSPTDFLRVNLTIGFNLINAAKEVQIKQLINLGSSCMYPKDYINPLKEEYILKAPLEPTNEGYALAKITVAKLCEYINKEYGYAYKTLIPCNLYGRWDKFDEKHSHMVPGVIRKIHFAYQNDIENVDIWGNGLARREFMYAEDCADAIFFILKNFEKFSAYTNIGLGYDNSINEFYQTIAKVIGYTGKFTHDLTKPSGMQQKLNCIDKMNSLGWKAKYTLLDGIQETYKFYLAEVCING